MKINQASIIKIGSQFLIGMLGAVLVFLCVPKQRIGVVNITSIIDQYVKTEVGQNLPPEELKKRIRAFGLNLEKTVHEIAQKKHLVLLPTEAVVAGGADYTALVSKELVAAEPAFHST